MCRKFTILETLTHTFRNSLSGIVNTGMAGTPKYCTIGMSTMSIYFILI